MADEVKGDPKKVGSEEDKLQLVIVTGLSGAGKSAALHAFEDIGFHAVDNLPLTMIETLVDDQSKNDPNRPLVIGVDSRTLHFSPENLLKCRRG